MTILAIETSCDETSAAVVRDGRILSNTVSSQIELHAEYGGVVPELAAREHLKNLMPIVRSALDAAGIGRANLPVSPDAPQRVPTEFKLDAVAATQGPGLPMALLVGLKAAQAVAFALRKPFIGIHHHEAHLYSPWIGSAGHRPGSEDAAHETGWDGVRRSALAADFSQFQPNVSLIVSGGHTMLVLVESELKHRVLGLTVDDAAGECFDKTGKLMGLAYPAGPEMDRLAESGESQGV